MAKHSQVVLRLNELKSEVQVDSTKSTSLNPKDDRFHSRFSRRLHYCCAGFAHCGKQYVVSIEDTHSGFLSS